MSIQRQMLLPALPNLLLKPMGEKYPLVKTTSLRLAAWNITGKSWKLKKFQAMHPNLSPCPGYQVWLQVTNWPGASGLAGVVNNKLTSLCTFKWNTELFIDTENGLQYQTINSHCCAISAYHDYVDRKPVGKHYQFCALLTGVCYQKSPQPRYRFVWDVEMVLVNLKTNIFNNSQLSDKDLTHELTILMALSSVSRASSIQHLNTTLVTRNDNRFYLHKVYKVGEGLNLHQQSHIKHTHKFLAFMLLRY